jgi:RecB family exonuclease
MLQFYNFGGADNLDTVVDQALFNQHLTDPGDALRTEVRLFFTRLRSDPVLQQALFGARESHQEIPFSLALDGLVLTGQIDRLVRTRLPGDPQERWLIVDYKTQIAATAAEKDRLTHHFAFQMSAYALAVAQRFGQDTVTALILFTAGPESRLLRFSPADLHAARERLLALHTGLTQALATAEFPLTQDPFPCKNCEYYPGNDCGIRDVEK